GGFTMEDAEAVCDAFDVFECVMELRRQSFFRVETDSESQQTRFQMLDVLREYGAEKLAEANGLGGQTRRRHAEHFLRFAQERLATLRTGAEAGALHVLERSSDNLRASLEWARQAEDRKLWGELALANGMMAQRHGFLQEAAETIDSGIQALESSDPEG